MTTESKVNWTREDTVACYKEGWGPFTQDDGSVRVQTLDEPSLVAEEIGYEGKILAFPTDEDAQRFVLKRAQDGSDLHKRALLLVEKRQRPASALRTGQKPLGPEGRIPMPAETAIEFCCPKCEDYEHLTITALIDCNITQNTREGVVGSEPEGDHEWDDDSHARCRSCGYQGKLTTFSVNDDEYTLTRSRFAAEKLCDLLQRALEQLKHEDSCVIHTSEKQKSCSCLRAEIVDALRDHGKR